MSPKDQPRKRPFKYPTLQRTSADGRLEFTPPSYPSLRGWVLDQPDHALLHSLIVGYLRDPARPVWDVIQQTPEFAPVSAGIRPAVPLRVVLRLLERLTISTAIGHVGMGVMFGPLQYGPLRVETKTDDPREWRRVNQYVYRAAEDDARRAWIAWCLKPLDRDDRFLNEYRVLLAQLTELAKGPKKLRYVLLELIGPHGGVLQLGSWACGLPSNWQIRCPWQESPSDWAEFLSALRYATNTRAIKERLRDANFELSLKAAWTAYGKWLLHHREAVQELESAVAGLQIDLGDEVMAVNRKP